MKKIPTIFKRNPEKLSELLNEPHPECGWVFDGEGIATRKYDGTCVMFDGDGKMWKRREVKKRKKVPEGFVELSVDPVTGKRMGWLPVSEEDSSDRWHREARDVYTIINIRLQAGTYELVGPKINDNPEGAGKHSLWKHTNALGFMNAPRDFDGLKKWLADKNIEGIVFHHPDGRMGKIKKRDFGLDREDKK